MAVGRRKRSRQQPLYVDAGSLITGGHPFYQKLNSVLAKHGFDDFAEARCSGFYAEKNGRPSIPPGVYFRMLMVGYFEGLDSERGIAWRCADSLSLREFLGCELNEAPPDHSSVSRTRRLMDLETHGEVFGWALAVVAEEVSALGKTVGIDSTTLEANAALRSIVRRDSGQSYEQYLTQLAKASGIETPTREDLAKIDKNRPKKGSNQDWQHPQDPDARITKMKDGTTHLAHKLEHAVDLNSGAVVAVTVQEASTGDGQSLEHTLQQAQDNVADLEEDEEDVEVKEVVLDRGYHSNATVMLLQEAAVRGYVAEPDRGRRRWKAKELERDAVYANRRRIRGSRGKMLQRRRSELLERGFAHCLETGGMRRVFLRGHQNILKRVLIHTSAFNLGLVMRSLVGSGTPRGLAALARLYFLKLSAIATAVCRIRLLELDPDLLAELASATGC